MLREVGCFTEKQVNVHAEHIDEANVVSPEQALATPSIKQPPIMRSSRPLKRTYTVAGQQLCPKHQEKTDLTH